MRKSKKKVVPDEFSDILPNILASIKSREIKEMFESQSKKIIEISAYDLIKNENLDDIDYKKFLESLYLLLKNLGYQILDENFDSKPFSICKP